jgi:hypothetical protein
MFKSMHTDTQARTQDAAADDFVEGGKGYEGDGPAGFGALDRLEEGSQVLQRVDILPACSRKS